MFSAARRSKREPSFDSERNERPGSPYLERGVTCITELATLARATGNRYLSQPPARL